MKKYCYDYGARFYDPAIGRWYSPDPTAPFTPGITPYHYTYNNPINLYDPNGLWPEWLDKLIEKRKYKRQANGKPNKHDRKRNSRQGRASRRNYHADATGRKAPRSEPGPAGGPPGGVNRYYDGVYIPGILAVNDFDNNVEIPETNFVMPEFKRRGLAERLINNPGRELPIDLYIHDESNFDEENVDVDDYIDELYKISEFLETNPQFTITIIISTPFLQNYNFDLYGNSRTWKETTDMVRNRAAIIEGVLRNSGPILGRNQVRTKINWSANSKFTEIQLN